MISRSNDKACYWQNGWKLHQTCKASKYDPEFSAIRSYSQWDCQGIYEEVFHQMLQWLHCARAWQW